MTFDSDEELMGHVRGEVGVKQDSDLPERDLKEELERGKAEINREIRERLNNSQSLDFYDTDNADQQALRYFLLIRARSIVVQNRGIGGVDLGRDPRSIASIRHHDYDDQTMNHWRDRMVTFLNKITE